LPGTTTNGDILFDMLNWRRWCRSFLF